MLHLSKITQAFSAILFIAAVAACTKGDTTPQQQHTSVTPISPAPTVYDTLAFLIFQPNGANLVAVGDSAYFLGRLTTNNGNLYNGFLQDSVHDYFWSFGDGSTSSDSAIYQLYWVRTYHIYTAPGTYTAQLTIKDAFHSKPVTVNVCADPIYTSHICSSRLWTGGRMATFDPFGGDTTFTTLPDSTFAITYLDKVDLNLWSTHLVYAPTSSGAGQLLFTAGSIDKIYYNAAKDSTSINMAFDATAGPHSQPLFCIISYHTP